MTSQAIPGVTVLLHERLRPVATPLVDTTFVSTLAMKESLNVSRGLVRYEPSRERFWRSNAWFRDVSRAYVVTAKLYAAVSL